MADQQALDGEATRSPAARLSPSSPPPTQNVLAQPGSTSNPVRLNPNVMPRQTAYNSRPTNLSWSAQDPRAESTESLVPSDEQGDKRILLLIYIHGFMGDETSFQSFPAHVHNVVTNLLQRTHVVHTKIYPKYRSRKHIQFARDNFSEWMTPHEGKDVDIILCGHSMGGLLSAEVALLPPSSPQDPAPFKHRILGTMNFDVPFLGLHPGVVLSGIGSLFRPAPKTPTAQSSDGPLLGPNSSQSQVHSLLAGGASESSVSLAEPSTNDPNYNPPFPNDVNLPVRKGWENALHFLQKHSDGLTRATKSYVKSHLEFGGAVTDQLALRARYRAIRALEDVKPSDESDDFRAPRRVRFVNYYTSSTGITKKSPVRNPEEHKSSSPSGSNSLDPYAESTVSTSSPRISVEEPKVAPVTQQSQDTSVERHPTRGVHSRTSSATSAFVSIDSRNNQSEVAESKHEERPHTSNSVDEKNVGESSPANASPLASVHDLARVAPNPEPEPEPEPEAESGLEPGLGFPADSESASKQEPQLDIDDENGGLPPLPDLPEPPPSFDPSIYADKDARKLAEREHDRKVKAHARAAKDRDQAIKERRKMLEKREREAKKKQQKEEEAAAKMVKEETKRQQKVKEAAYKQWRNELKAIEKKQKAREKQALEEAKTLQAEAGRMSEEAESAGALDGGTRPELEGTAEAGTESEKKGRDHRFCLLPSRDARGKRDSAWLRVFMRDVDEVIAHCGLFDPWREHYEDFIQQVGNMIKQWVEDDMRTREAREQRNESRRDSTWIQRDEHGTEHGVLEVE